MRLSACFYSQDWYLASQNLTKIHQKCIRSRVRAVLTQQIFLSPKAFPAGHMGNMSKGKDKGIEKICSSKPTWFDSRTARFELLYPNGYACRFARNSPSVACGASFPSGDAYATRVRIVWLAVRESNQVGFDGQIFPIPAAFPLDILPVCPAGKAFGIEKICFVKTARTRGRMHF